MKTKFNKKITAVLLAAAMLLTVGCGEKKAKAGNKLDEIKEKGYITVATSPDFGPYEFMDLTKEGEDAIVGCEVELAKYIAEYIGVECKMESMDFATCQAATSTGSVDISIAGYAKTDERAESMECSNYYNWSSEDDAELQGIIIKADKLDSYNSAEDFAGKKIAVQNGSLQMNLVTAQLPEDITIESISSINDGIMMLLTDKVDALASASETGLQFCKNYSELTMSNFYFDYSSEGSVILGKKGETELMEKVNEALAKAAEEKMFEVWLKDATDLCNELGVEVN